MATNMTVNHQTIEKLFSEFKSTPLLIPDYQRPYDWTEDNMEQLINDVRDFSEDWFPDSGLSLRDPPPPKRRTSETFRNLLCFVKIRITPTRAGKT